MKTILKQLFDCRFIVITSLLICARCVAQSNYYQLITNANTLLKDGKLDEARQAAQQAIQQDAKGYMAYAISAKIASQQGAPEDVANFLKRALDFAPDEDSKAKVRQLAANLSSPGSQPGSHGSSQISPEDRRILDALDLILEDVQNAVTLGDRTNALREYLSKSADFAGSHREQTNVWVMRAFAAVELDYPGAGFEAGQQLKEFGLQNSDDPKMRRQFAELERKGWLGTRRTFRDWSKWTMDQVKGSAAGGDSESQVALGDWYRFGQGGLSHDYVEAAKWFRYAAEQGDSDGRTELGQFYQNGWGVDKDYAEAVKWFRKAAVCGNANGQFKMGLMRENGWGVDKDLTEAVKWYRQAADHGCPNAQALLGTAYANGLGVEKNYVEAIKLAREAAEQGCAAGQMLLGWCYLNGNGVDKNYADAVKWTRKAAEQSDSTGENNLGVCYENGYGVDKDLAEAAKWYRKASEHGNTLAKTNLERLSNNPQLSQNKSN